VKATHFRAVLGTMVKHPESSRTAEISGPHYGLYPMFIVVFLKERSEREKNRDLQCAFHATYA